MKYRIIITTIMILGSLAQLRSQDCSMSDSLLIDRIKRSVPVFNVNLPGTSVPGKGASLDRGTDSAFWKEFAFLINKAAEGGNRSGLSFEQGYMNYNLSYREAIDTPFMESDIFQHLITANAHFVAGGYLPVEVTYFERNSNSGIFRDYRDFRIEINPHLFRQIQAGRARQKIAGNISRVMHQKRGVAEQYFEEIEKLNSASTYLNSPDLISLMVTCKERLINADEYSQSCRWNDSAVWYSTYFIDRLSDYEHLTIGLTRKTDSLKSILDKQRKRAAGIMQMLKKPVFQTADIKRLNDLAAESGALPAASGPGLKIAGMLRQFSLGRTIPSQSPLTVNGLNIRGANIALEGDNWYVSLVAGAVDMRLFDFNKRPEKNPRQFVYSMRGGWGRKELTHFYITCYKGERLLYPGSIARASISGISAELQYVIAQGHRVTVEIAQSASTQSVSGINPPPDKLSLKNNNARAYFIRWQSSFPRLHARVEGTYQKSGIDFQAFNAYRVNAATEMFNLRYDQHLFRKTLTVTAAVRKNDFSNPFVIHDYRSNTIFKTIQVGFRKRNWPLVSAGFIPSSQYSKVNETVYETQYQILNTNIYHAYTIGTASATTNILLSRFFDNRSDSLHLYSGALNISFFQQFRFKLHMATLGINYTKSASFLLGIGQAGVGTTTFKWLQAEAGVKIFRNQAGLTKTGLYGQGVVSLKKWGVIRCWYDDGFLPSPSGELVKNRQWNLSYIKFFKKRQ